jgi:glutamate synthase (NADPH/NADH) small chain
MEQGYQAVFVGIGAHQAQPLNVAGSDMAGVVNGIDFLRQVNLGQSFEVGDDVVVVGGGSTAMDAARTAKRLGARNVRIVYRRTRTEMPAQLDEVVDAEEEGIEMDFLANPLRINESGGKVSGIRCIRTELGDFEVHAAVRPRAIQVPERPRAAAVQRKPERVTLLAQRVALKCALVLVIVADLLIQRGHLNHVIQLC